MSASSRALVATDSLSAAVPSSAMMTSGTREQAGFSECSSGMTRMHKRANLSLTLSEARRGCSTALTMLACTLLC